MYYEDEHLGRVVARPHRDRYENKDYIDRCRENPRKSEFLDQDVDRLFRDRYEERDYNDKSRDQRYYEHSNYEYGNIPPRVTNRQDKDVFYEGDLGKVNDAIFVRERDLPRYLYRDRDRAVQTRVQIPVHSEFASESVTLSDRSEDFYDHKDDMERKHLGEHHFPPPEHPPMVYPDHHEEFRPRMPHFTPPFRSQLSGPGRPWQAHQYRSHSRRRHHLDDIFLANHDDEEFDSSRHENSYHTFRPRSSFNRPPVRIDVRRGIPNNTSKVKYNQPKENKDSKSNNSSLQQPDNCTAKNDSPSVCKETIETETKISITCSKEMPSSTRNSVAEKKSAAIATTVDSKKCTEKKIIEKRKFEQKSSTCEANKFSTVSQTNKKDETFNDTVIKSSLASKEKSMVPKLGSSEQKLCTNKIKEHAESEKEIITSEKHKSGHQASKIDDQLKSSPTTNEDKSNRLESSNISISNERTDRPNHTEKLHANLRKENDSVGSRIKNVTQNKTKEKINTLQSETKKFAINQVEEELKNNYNNYQINTDNKEIKKLSEAQEIKISTKNTFSMKNEGRPSKTNTSPDKGCLKITGEIAFPVVKKDKVIDNDIVKELEELINSPENTLLPTPKQKELSASQIDSQENIANTKEDLVEAVDSTSGNKMFTFKHLSPQDVKKDIKIKLISVINSNTTKKHNEPEDDKESKSISSCQDASNTVKLKMHKKTPDSKNIRKHADSSTLRRQCARTLFFNSGQNSGRSSCDETPCIEDIFIIEEALNAMDNEPEVVIGNQSNSENFEKSQTKCPTSKQGDESPSEELKIVDPEPPTIIIIDETSENDSTCTKKLDINEMNTSVEIIEIISPDTDVGKLSRSNSPTNIEVANTLSLTQRFGEVNLDTQMSYLNSFKTLFDDNRTLDMEISHTPSPSKNLDDTGRTHQQMETDRFLKDMDDMWNNITSPKENNVKPKETNVKPPKETNVKPPKETNINPPNKTNVKVMRNRCKRSDENSLEPENLEPKKGTTAKATNQQTNSNSKDDKILAQKNNDNLTMTKKKTNVVHKRDFIVGEELKVDDQQNNLYKSNSSGENKSESSKENSLNEEKSKSPRKQEVNKQSKIKISMEQDNLDYIIQDVKLARSKAEHLDYEHNSNPNEANNAFKMDNVNHSNIEKDIEELIIPKLINKDIGTNNKISKILRIQRANLPLLNNRESQYENMLNKTKFPIKLTVRNRSKSFSGFSFSKTISKPVRKTQSLISIISSNKVDFQPDKHLKSQENIQEYSIIPTTLVKADIGLNDAQKEDDIKSNQVENKMSAVNDSTDELISILSSDSGDKTDLTALTEETSKINKEVVCNIIDINNKIDSESPDVDSDATVDIKNIKRKSKEVISKKKRKRVRRIDSSDDEDFTLKNTAVVAKLQEKKPQTKNNPKRKRSKSKEQHRKNKTIKMSDKSEPVCPSNKVNSSVVNTALSIGNRSQSQTKACSSPATTESETKCVLTGKYVTKAEYVKTFARTKSPVNISLSIKPQPKFANITRRRATFTCEADNETILKRVDDKDRKYKEQFIQLFGAFSEDEEEIIQRPTKNTAYQNTDKEKLQDQNERKRSKSKTSMKYKNTKSDHINTDLTLPQESRETVTQQSKSNLSKLNERRESSSSSDNRSRKESRKMSQSNTCVSRSRSKELNPKKCTISTQEIAAEPGLPIEANLAARRQSTSSNDSSSRHSHKRRKSEKNISQERIPKKVDIKINSQSSDKDKFTNIIDSVFEKIYNNLVPPIMNNAKQLKVAATSPPNTIAQIKTKSATVRTNQPNDVEQNNPNSGISTKKPIGVDRRKSAPDVLNSTLEPPLLTNKSENVPLICRASENEIDESFETYQPYFQILPHCNKISTCEIQENECTDTVYICDPPEIQEDIIVVLHKIDIVDDDVIEIPATVPMIDLTEEDEKEDNETSQQETLADLLLETKREIQKIAEEQGLITLYRSEENESNTEDVQVVSASISTNQSTANLKVEQTNLSLLSSSLVSVGKSLPIIHRNISDPLTSQPPSKSNQESSSDRSLADNSSVVSDSCAVNQGSPVTADIENANLKGENNNVSLLSSSLDSVGKSLPTSVPIIDSNISDPLTSQPPSKPNQESSSDQSLADNSSVVSDSFAVNQGSPVTADTESQNSISTVLQLLQGQPKNTSHKRECNTEKNETLQNIILTASADSNENVSKQKSFNNNTPQSIEIDGNQCTLNYNSHQDTPRDTPSELDMSDSLAMTDDIPPTSNSNSNNANGREDLNVPAECELGSNSANDLPRIALLPNIDDGLYRGTGTQHLNSYNREIPQVPHLVRSKQQSLSQRRNNQPAPTHLKTYTTDTYGSTQPLIDLTNENSEPSTIELRLIVDIFSKHIYFLANLCNVQNEYVRSLRQKLFYKFFFVAEIALFEEQKKDRLLRQSMQLLKELQYLNIRASRNLSETASLIVDYITSNLANKDMPKTVTKSLVYLFLGELMNPTLEAFASIPLFKTLIRHCSFVKTKINVRYSGPFTEEMRLTLLNQIQAYNRLCVNPSLFASQESLNIYINQPNRQMEHMKSNQISRVETSRSNVNPSIPTTNLQIDTLNVINANPTAENDQLLNQRLTNAIIIHNRTPGNIIANDRISNANQNIVPATSMKKTSNNIPIRHQQLSHFQTGCSSRFPVSMYSRSPSNQDHNINSQTQEGFARPRLPNSHSNTATVLPGGANTNTLGYTPRYITDFDRPNRRHVYTLGQSRFPPPNSKNPGNSNTPLLQENLRYHVSSGCQSILSEEQNSQKSPQYNNAVKVGNTMPGLPTYDEAIATNRDITSQTSSYDSRQQSEILLRELLSTSEKPAMFAKPASTVNDNFRIKLPFTKPPTPPIFTFTSTSVSSSRSICEQSKTDSLVSKSGSLPVPTVLFPKPSSPTISLDECTQTSNSILSKILSNNSQQDLQNSQLLSVNSRSPSSLQTALSGNTILVNNEAASNSYIVGAPQNNRVLNQGLAALSSIGQASTMLQPSANIVQSHINEPVVNLEGCNPNNQIQINQLPPCDPRSPFLLEALPNATFQENQLLELTNKSTYKSPQSDQLLVAPPKKNQEQKNSRRPKKSQPPTKSRPPKKNLPKEKSIKIKRDSLKASPVMEPRKQQNIAKEKPSPIRNYRKKSKKIEIETVEISSDEEMSLETDLNRDIDSTVKAANVGNAENYEVRIQLTCNDTQKDISVQNPTNPFPDLQESVFQKNNDSPPMPLGSSYPIQVISDSFAEITGEPPSSPAQNENIPELELPVLEQPSLSMVPDATEEESETIDLTWIDDMDDIELKKEMDFVLVKQEYKENEITEEHNNRVVLSPADSGIASPPVQNEDDTTYTVVQSMCICGIFANYNCACGDAWYCGEECQLNDWGTHHKVCHVTHEAINTEEELVRNQEDDVQPDQT